MVDSSVLTLPPELRVKIYQHLTPTVSPKAEYAGIRLSCRTLQREFDYEVLQDLRRQYHHNMSVTADLPLIIYPPSNMEDIHTLEMKVGDMTPQLLLGVRSLELIPWCFTWLQNIIITYDSCGHEEFDVLITGAFQKAISKSIANDHRGHPRCSNIQGCKVEDVSTIKRIVFKWAERSDRVPYPTMFISWLGAFLRGDQVAFDMFTTRNWKMEVIGYEWRRARTWQEAKTEIFIAMVLSVLAVGFIAMLPACMKTLPSFWT